jgi:hypothetical protein
MFTRVWRDQIRADKLASPKSFAIIFDIIIRVSIAAMFSLNNATKRLMQRGFSIQFQTNLNFFYLQQLHSRGGK